MDNLKTKKIQTAIFPEGAGAVVMSLINKYGLKQAQDTALEKLISAKKYQEKILAAENLPSRKIATILKEAAEKNLGHDNLASWLQNNFGLTKDKAEGLASDLEKQLISLAQKTYIEESISTKPPVSKPIKSIEETPSREANLPQKTAPPKKPDVYRETIK